MAAIRDKGMTHGDADMPSLRIEGRETGASDSEASQGKEDRLHLSEVSNGMDNHSFRWLSIYQRATIGDMQKLRIELGFVGLDAMDDPVVWVKDVKRTFMMAVRRDGSGRDAIEPLRSLTDAEVEAMTEHDSVLLFSLQPKSPTQEVWHEPRRTISVN